MTTTMQLHQTVAELRAAYAADPFAIDWYNLTAFGDEDAIKFLREHLDKICWSALPYNRGAQSAALQLLRENPVQIAEHVGFSSLAAIEHEVAIQILRDYPGKINWGMLSKNAHSDAFSLCVANPGKINWGMMLYNTHPEAGTLIRKNLDKLNWDEMSGNSYGINATKIGLLRENLGRVNWSRLSGNHHPYAVALLLEHPDKIEWRQLAGNNNRVATKYFDDYHRAACRK